MISRRLSGRGENSKMGVPLISERAWISKKFAKAEGTSKKQNSGDNYNLEVPAPKLKHWWVH